ncbi:hypothetical protein FY534_14105 (plasmid) [Alicyclobacillus sp. TC]|uniref:Uncharacterized protein n=1 Tax=Alicyclobacillus tolerans TaxID=90970 RepID=A0ABT9M050_9BACL|nr:MULTISPECIES: hypothetical protein [Alicyclobacillus]MDP9729890.1 hypothetical protein [Alicyclobacillus tengchongensis]QRF24905.1 hypothetical protein FY534_14105 [Alicyclobacillus sp. TC]
MPNYTLNIEIDAESLKKIYASNEKLTLVKQTDPSQTEVAWVAFYPFENNTVQWTESYAVYASQTELTAGTTIKKVSTRSAADQNAYAFAQGSFDLATPKQSLGKGQYQVIKCAVKPLALAMGI